jgi:hypothetical protein
MCKNLFSGVLATLLIFMLFAVSVSAAQEEDHCRSKGIVVRNATMLDLWYKKNGGKCFIWQHEHLFTIKPEDNIDIYSDMTCQTFYCADNPTYKKYESVDADGDCRVKILPYCNISDM